MTARALLVLALSGCTGADTPIEHYFGEVHVHQYESSAHVEATFLVDATPASQVIEDSIVPGAFQTATVVDGCRIVTNPRCASTCGAAQYCSGTECVPLVELRFADGGEIEVTGGRITNQVVLRYKELVGYDVVFPAERNGSVFSGGESLVIDGAGAIVPAFSGSLSTPMPLDVAVGPEVPLTWVPAGASDYVKIVVSASDDKGAYAIGVCTRPDREGGFEAPAELAAAFPQRPRDIQIEVSRNLVRTAHANVNPKLGVLLHTGYSKNFGWHED